MDENGGCFRRKKVNFSTVSNEILRDDTISLKAKGLYALIQSYITLENFTLYKGFLQSHCCEGEKAFESTWKELKDTGYLLQYRMQGEKGMFYYEYELADFPEISPVPQKGGTGERSLPIKEAPVEGGTRKRTAPKMGVHNNTIPNNTLQNNTLSNHIVSIKGPYLSFGLLTRGVTICYTPNRKQKVRLALNSTRTQLSKVTII